MDDGVPSGIGVVEDKEVGMVAGSIGVVVGNNGIAVGEFDELVVAIDGLGVGYGDVAGRLSEPTGMLAEVEVVPTEPRIVFAGALEGFRPLLTRELDVDAPSRTCAAGGSGL